MNIKEASELYRNEPFPVADEVTYSSNALTLRYGHSFYYVHAVYSGMLWWKRRIGYDLLAIEGDNAAANFLGHISGHPSTRSIIGRFDTAADAAKCIRERLNKKRP